MVDRCSWFQKAEPEQQGSFCDTQSGSHIDNMDKSTTEDSMESAYRRGDAVVGNGVDTEEHPPDQRYNHVQTDIDGQGYEFPTRLGPGR